VLPNTTPLLMFEREIKRRCFWAIWCSIALAEPLSISNAVLDGVAGLPLPAKFGANRSGQEEEIHEGQRAMSEWGLGPIPTHAIPRIDHSPPVSLMAILVKYLGVW
jgi:hypothetical protein